MWGFRVLTRSSDWPDNIRGVIMYANRERPLLRRTFLRQSGAALAASAVASFAQTNSRSRTAPQSTPSLSRQFARWAAGLKYDDLPPTVIDRAKGVTLQALS